MPLVGHPRVLTRGVLRVIGSALAVLGATAEPGSAQDQAAATAPAAAVQFRMDEHPTIQIGSDLEIVLRARIESALRTGSPAVDDAVEADWRRRRVQVEGSFKRLEFEFSHEFGDPVEPERDAFVNLRLARPLQVQAGRFKVPFGRDALKSGANLDFVFRSLLGRILAPGRDVGVMAHGRLNRTVSYQAGYFTRDGDNARSAQGAGGDDSLAGRVELTPFAGRNGSAVEPLEIGLAFTRSHADDVLGFRGYTVFGDTVFFDRVFVNGPRRRLGVDMAWLLGPASVTAEFADTTDHRNGMGAVGEDLPAIGATAWYVSGSWVLTGERKRARVEPRRSVMDGGFGAVEVAARLERLSFETVVYPGGVTHGPNPRDLEANGEWVTTFAVSWFPHTRVKVQGNLVIESVDDPSRSPAPRGNGRFTSGIVNFQFVL